VEPKEAVIEGGEKSLDMTPAIRGLLKPFWEEVKNRETLEEFTEAFFIGGGKVNILMPSWLKERLGIEEEPIYGEGTHFIVPT